MLFNSAFYFNHHNHTLKSHCLFVTLWSAFKSTLLHFFYNFQDLFCCYEVTAIFTYPLTVQRIKFERLLHDTVQHQVMIPKVRLRQLCDKLHCAMWKQLPVDCVVKTLSEDWRFC